MVKTHPPYAPEFRRQLVELVRAGRDPGDLAREFEPSAQAIRNWVVQADLQDGRREAKPAADAGLSAAEREELTRLRRENRCGWSTTFSLERGLVCPREGRAAVRIFAFMSANQACFPICVTFRCPATGHSFARHAGVAQTGVKRSLRQGGDRGHAPRQIAANAGDAGITIVADQLARFGEFGGGAFDIA
jgi:transposase